MYLFRNCYDYTVLPSGSPLSIFLKSMLCFHRRLRRQCNCIYFWAVALHLAIVCFIFPAVVYKWIVNSFQIKDCMLFLYLTFKYVFSTMDGIPSTKWAAHYFSVSMGAPFHPSSLNHISKLSITTQLPSHPFWETVSWVNLCLVKWFTVLVPLVRHNTKILCGLEGVCVEHWLFQGHSDPLWGRHAYSTHPLTEPMIDKFQLLFPKRHICFEAPADDDMFYKRQELEP